MSLVSRREWLAGIAVSALAAVPKTQAFGVQLEAGQADPEAFLKAAAAAGYTEVEGYGRRETLSLLPKIRQCGLTPRSCIIESGLITDFQPGPLTDAIEALKQAGVEYCPMSIISPGARGDGDDFFRRTADRMNAGGELCRKAGLKLAWANEAFEFEGGRGSRPIDIYRERLDPKYVVFEMDVVQVRIARQNPVELLKQWKGRVPLVRLRDKLKNSWAAVGQGETDLPAILKAAQAAGARDYFVYDDPANLRKALEVLQKPAK